MQPILLMDLLVSIKKNSIWAISLKAQVFTAFKHTENQDQN